MFAVVPFGAYWFLWVPRQEEKAAQLARANAPAQAPPQAAQFTPDASQSVELATAASIHRQQLTAAKFKQRQAIAAFDELTRDIEAWEKERTAWQSEIPPLLKNEEGKRIAAEPALTRRFRAVYKQELPSGESIAAARRQAEELISPVRESLANAEDAAPPSEDIVKTIRELQTQVRNSREQYRQARESVSTLFVGASDPGPRTLEDALLNADHYDSLQRLATIEAEEKKARDEGTRLIAEERAKLIAVESEAAAQLLRDEAAKKKQASDQAAARSVEEMELKQKEAASEISRLRDVAEQKRQGALKTGSVWKGTSSRSGLHYETTLTITSRTKDEAHVTIQNIQGNLGGPELVFDGTIQGNTLRLKRADTLTTSDLEGTYNAASQTITGNYTTSVGNDGSFSVRLQKSE